MKILFFLAVMASTFAHAETFSFSEDIGLDQTILSDDSIQALNEAAEQMPALDESNAPGMEEVTDPNIRLVGRGLQDRKTGDSFALACVGDIPEGKTERTCGSLRNVFFEAASHKAYYMGETYWVFGGDIPKNAIKTFEPTEQAVAQRAKELNRAFKKFRRSENHNRNFWIFLGVGVSAAPGFFFLTPASWAVSATGMPLAVAAYTGFMAVFFVASTIYNANGTFLTQTPGGNRVMIDKDGFNWSSKPKKVSHRNFELYRKFIR